MALRIFLGEKGAAGQISFRNTALLVDNNSLILCWCTTPSFSVGAQLPPSLLVLNFRLCWCSTPTCVGAQYPPCLQVHKYYERWLVQGYPRSPPAPVLVIDADGDLEEVLRHYRRHAPIILGQVPHSPV